MSFYTIPSTASFCDNLAQFVDDLATTHSCPLSKIKIYLPTRRSIRTLKDGFLRQSNGTPRILPKMMSIGDSTDDEISFSTLEFLDIPPAIHPLRRQIVLARLLEQAWKHDYNYIQALGLAADLGRLIDQIHTENITLDKLDTIINIREFSEHWEITLKFLKMVLGQLWPHYLQSEGKIDPALHRRLSIEQLTQFHQHAPSQYPVIVAGSTGSLPTTRDFISTIANMPNGIVILPALDTVLEPTAWEKIDTSHPQHHLKNLLTHCKIEREEVQIYGAQDKDYDRLLSLSEIMRPAPTTEKWQTLSTPQIAKSIQHGLSHITQCECHNEDAQARTIALSMAEIAADPDQLKTCALITPDRALSARVTAQLTQWGIDIDDSAGTPLPATPIGRFCLSLPMVIENNVLMPVPFLAAMKSKYAGGGALSDTFRSTLRQFEINYLRGIRPSTDLQGLKTTNDKQHDFIDLLDKAITPFASLINDTHPLGTWLNAHITIMENIATTTEMDGASRLWVGHQGEALSDFFANLHTFSDVTPDLSHYDYVAFVQNLMQTITVRPPYGTHPRLSILGQIESRMVQTDRVILGGLNEGVWPPDSGYDAFLSKPMRHDFGLPSLEHKTSLAAHDFATALGSQDVFITHSKRIGGSPALPSRWIQRLETVLTAANIDKHDWPAARGHQYIAWADELRHMNAPAIPIERPKPTPPIERRPTQFSVTDIAKWMKNPYHLYAKRVLQLRALDPVDMTITARDKGNLIHQAMEAFTRKFPKQLPDDSLEHLIALGKTVFDAQTYNPEIHGLWWPRFVKSAQWVAKYEHQWRQQTDIIHTETEASMPITIDGTDFTLTGKADRIEKRRGNEWAIIDYKTGTIPQKKPVMLGIENQLPLEGYMLMNNAFNGLSAPSDCSLNLYYWSLSGSDDGGKAEKAQDKKIDTSTLIDDAQNGLRALLSCFHNPLTPYMATPDPDYAIPIDHNDYAHLERIAEWSVIEGDND